MRVFVAYVPVVHEGYRQFFEKHEGEKQLYILGDALQKELGETVRVIAKDLRKLPAETAQKAVDALGIFASVHVLTPENVQELNQNETSLTLPDDEVSHAIAEHYFPQADVTHEPVFLMWDKHNALEERPVVADGSITREVFARDMMKLAEAEATKSSDIWRHVGAVLVKQGEVVLTAYNRHLPNDHTPYENGDPRNNFKKGDHIEISTGFHAEASLIAEAARRGIATEGSEMYVTVFPCPPCAKVLAHSGVKTLYCAGGYGVLDGEEILKDAGVKILFVE